MDCDQSSDEELSHCENSEVPYQKLKKTCKQKVISKLTKMFLTNNIEKDFNALLTKEEDFLSNLKEKYPEKIKFTTDEVKVESQDQNHSLSVADSFTSTSVLGGAIFAAYSGMHSHQAATKANFKENSSHSSYTESKSVEDNEEDRGSMYGMMRGGGRGSRIGFLL